MSLSLLAMSMFCGAVALLHNTKEPNESCNWMSVYNSSMFKVLTTCPSCAHNDIFQYGDDFLFDGVVNETGGVVTATTVFGKSLDHKIIFGNSSCSFGGTRQWNVTLVVGDTSVAGVCTSSYTNRAKFFYHDLKVKLQFVDNPRCGDTLPVFNSSSSAMFKIKLKGSSGGRDHGLFADGDDFKLNGSVDSHGGLVVAKNVFGTSPDHEIIFGNSVCENTLRRWNTIIKVGENTSHGSCRFDPSSYVSMECFYGDFLSLELLPPPNCSDALPVFNSSMFTVGYPANGIFVRGDVYFLDGAVNATGGFVVAKHFIGQSKDHTIVFGESFCEKSTLRWPLTVRVFEEATQNWTTLSGDGSFSSLHEGSLKATTILRYGELGSLNSMLPPQCGDMLPVLDSTLFEVGSDSATGTFTPGDQFLIEGFVNTTGGVVVAKQFIGKSPDHKITFDSSICDFKTRIWPVSVMINGSTSRGSCSFDTSTTSSTRKTLSCKYDKFKAHLSTARSLCDDSLPSFNSTFFEVSRAPADSTFAELDGFLLNGFVNESSGLVVAKHVSGKSPEHEIIFGNSVCRLSKREWPLTVVINGETSYGVCIFNVRTGQITLKYQDLESELTESPEYETCGVISTESSCKLVGETQCEWCVLKSDVHGWCIPRSKTSCVSAGHMLV